MSERADQDVLPTGTIVFLRTDIEGSMELVRVLGARYDELNELHQGVIRAAVARHGGRVVRTEGDAFFVVFRSIDDAAAAAVEIQQELASLDWPDGQAISVRVGLHAGTAHRAGDDYGGLEVNRAARIVAAAWGGQILLSDAARALLQGDLPAGWAIRDLGRHRLKGLAESQRLFQLDAPGLRMTFDPLRSGLDQADRLPERLSTLIGREHELEALEGLLATTRLLTLTGPGGSGKTTLAVELARRAAVDFEDGARFVDLQAVREPAAVRAEVAHGIGLFDGPAGPASERLTGYLADRSLLVVIDNFEQVVDATDVVADLLTSSPRSKAIVTSRVALRLRAEQEFPVRPMRIGNGDGDHESEAVRLFIDRARKVRPDLDLEATQIEQIRESCRLLDGLPLAIELCAARAGALPLHLIRERLAAHQPLPGAGPRDLPDRQRTIDAAVSWSHDLLDEPLRRLFARLSVFEESFDLRQAEQVCGPVGELGTDVLEGLVRLAASNLISRIEDAVGGVRYGWLRTIRQHAADRLASTGERSVIEGRHTQAFAELASEAAAYLPGGRQAWWLDRLAADDSNLRAALTRAIGEGDVETALTLAGSLWRYWLQTGRLSEGNALLTRALALPGAEAPTVQRVRALDAAGGIAYWSGDVPTANAFYEEELALARSIGDRPGEAIALLDLFFTREFGGDISAALDFRAQAASAMRELGDDFGLARVEMSTVLIMFVLGRDDPSMAASDMVARADALLALDDRWLARNGYAVKAFAAWTEGDMAAAVSWLRRALRENLFVRERTEAALGMQFFVVAAAKLGHPEAGALIHGACQAAQEELGIRAPASYVEMAGVDPIPVIRAELGEDAFQAAIERGRRLSQEEALDLIEELTASLG